MHKPKVFVIGLDGIPSDLLFKDLIKYLPNIQRMMQNGIFATLESCHPPITVPAWMVIKCSLDTCIKRDCKGLYKKALNGEIDNLIGLQDPYEEPINPEVIASTEQESPDKVTDKVISKLKDMGYI